MSKQSWSYFSSRCADSSFDPRAVGQSGFHPHFHCYIVQIKNHPRNKNNSNFSSNTRETGFICKVVVFFLIKRRYSCCNITALIETWQLQKENQTMNKILIYRLNVSNFNQDGSCGWLVYREMLMCWIKAKFTNAIHTLQFDMRSFLDMTLEILMGWFS